MGLLDPTTQQAKVTTDHYHADNRLAGTALSAYEIRNTSAHQFTFPLARPTVSGNPSTPTVDAPGRVVDMGLAIASTLTAGGESVNLGIQLVALIDLSAVGSSVNSASAILFGTENGVTDLPNNGRFWFLPEVSPGHIQTNTARMFAIPELRGPIDAIRVQVNARTAPDAGAISLRAVRRY